MRGDTMTTFIHTADWHLGMTRRYLSPDAQARYSEARIDAVREIARLADSEGAEFVVACGDLFDSNHVDRQVVARAVDALGSFTVPVFILPGNHDPLDAASVYLSSAFTDRCPPNVRVIDSAEPVTVGGIELVGAPWHAKNPGHDPAERALVDLAQGPTRVLLAHGVVDVLSPDAHDASVIAMEGLREALDAGLLAYVALGDRHSATEVGGDQRVRYPGTPVATDYGEVDPGQALVVRIEGTEVQVQAHRVGAWTFVRSSVRLESLDDVEALDASLTAIPDKARTIVRLDLVGALGIGEDARLQAVLDDHQDVLASLTVSERGSDLVVFIEEGDLHNLDLKGYAYDAAAEVAALAAVEGPQQDAARDALRLLYRLARNAA